MNSQKWLSRQLHLKAAALTGSCNIQVTFQDAVGLAVQWVHTHLIGAEEETWTTQLIQNAQLHVWVSSNVEAAEATATKIISCISKLHTSHLKPNCYWLLLLLLEVPLQLAAPQETAWPSHIQAKHRQQHHEHHAWKCTITSPKSFLTVEDTHRHQAMVWLEVSNPAKMNAPISGSSCSLVSALPAQHNGGSRTAQVTSTV